MENFFYFLKGFFKLLIYKLYKRSLILKNLLTILHKIISRIKNDYLTRYSFIIVPHTNKKTINLSIKKLYVHILISLIVFVSVYSLVISITTTIFKTNLHNNIASVNELAITNKEQLQYISTLEENISQMKITLSEIEELETHLKEIVGYEDEEENQEESK